MEIQVDNDDWGEARVQDIQRLLEDVASQLLRYFDNAPPGLVRVQCRTNAGVPRILYRSSWEQEHVIWLTVRNRQWDKFAYQFSHELCHLLSNYECLRCIGNHWFHESLCELASLFTLKQMASTWQSSPPFSNWSSYAPCLEAYAQEIILREEHQLPSGLSLAEWFRVNEPKLRVDPYQRPLNGLVAVQLLPLIQASPSQWQSVRYMPDTDGYFGSFLLSWRDACPQAYQSLIGRVAAAFDIALP